MHFLVAIDICVRVALPAARICLESVALMIYWDTTLNVNTLKYLCVNISRLIESCLCVLMNYL